MTETEYYVVATDDFTDETTHYIGEATIAETCNENPVSASRDYAPAVTGAVKRVWETGPEGGWFKVPESMDASNPEHIAVLIGGSQRVYPESDVFFGKDHIVVFELAARDVVDVGWHELGHEEQEIIDEDPDGMADRICKKEFFWDDDVIPPEAVPNNSCRVDDASYLIGYVDGQDLHDPYGHIGTSTADAAFPAIRDVVEQRGKWTWPPHVSAVDTVSTYTTDSLFSSELTFVDDVFSSVSESDTL
ncbi:hypothetical protein [Salinibaculum rarum]|uniref:hypothetical protein n=1 Tax=Salinibaculum rarum TaxID=3058903 RepID=UPI002660222C|nr:hypothetical protein [Salinibaculum sp. KK48]